MKRVIYLWVDEKTKKSDIFNPAKFFHNALN